MLLVRRTRLVSLLLGGIIMAPNVLFSIRTSFRSVVQAESSSYRLRQVQIIHRHGDRTPITPMKDEAYWSNLLIPPDVFTKLAQGTTLIRNPEEPNQIHVAAGRGPFGKLTALGLLQMVQVGTELRERFMAADPEENTSESATHQQPHLWDHDTLPESTDVRVFSTDFPRTIQSVQGLLSGLFPHLGDSSSTTTTPTPSIPIDVRPSSWMIPDPMPRFTHEQEQLERTLAMTPIVQEREQTLRPLAMRVTHALHEYLAHDAHDAAFGVEGEHPGQASIEIQPLAWVQLAEITKCMAVRGILPPSISTHDQETIAAHAAWRWFHTLSHPRMAYLGMHRLVQQQVQYFMEQQNMVDPKSPKMIIWSGHDSTLIGLLCAYRLERPSTWPEYASYLCMELLQDESTHQFWVRFSLNGQILKSHWEGEDEPRDMIPLELLQQKVDTMGAHHSERESSMV